MFLRWDGTIHKREKIVQNLLLEKAGQSIVIKLKNERLQRQMLNVNWPNLQSEGLRLM